MRLSSESHGEYLDSRGYGAEPETPSESLISRLQERYDIAKKTSVGLMIRCPACNKEIKKTAYNKTFCSNQRTRRKGQSSCKDSYWNMVDVRKWNYLQQRENEE